MLTKLAFIIIIQIDWFYRFFHGFQRMTDIVWANAEEERAMERLLNEQLNQWRQNPKRKPLVLKGALHIASLSVGVLFYKVKRRKGTF